MGLPDVSINALPDERTAAIADDVTVAELDLDLAPFDRWKPQRIPVAFRHGRVVLLSDFNTLVFGNTLVFLGQFPPTLYPHLCIFPAREP